jgi:hypothetical protein
MQAVAWLSWQQFGPEHNLAQIFLSRAAFGKTPHVPHRNSAFLRDIIGPQHGSLSEVWTRNSQMDTLRLWLVLGIFIGTAVYTVAVMVLQPI